MFKLHNSARAWAEPLLSEKAPFTMLFDIYYLSFMTGIGLGLSGGVDNNQQTEFIKALPGAYQKYGNGLVGSLIIHELKNSGVEMNRDNVKRQIDLLMVANSSNPFSDFAMDLMNKYAYFGFEELKFKFPHPKNSAEFLLWFDSDIRPRLFSEGVWS